MVIGAYKGARKGGKEHWEKVRDIAEETSKDLFPQIRKVGIRQVHLVGHSLGARVMHGSLKTKPKEIDVRSILYLGATISNSADQCFLVFLGRTGTWPNCRTKVEKAGFGQKGQGASLL